MDSKEGNVYAMDTQTYWAPLPSYVVCRGLDGITIDRYSPWKQNVGDGAMLMHTGLWALDYGLWVRGSGLWALGSGL